MSAQLTVGEYDVVKPASASWSRTPSLPFAHMALVHATPQPPESVAFGGAGTTKNRGEYVLGEGSSYKSSMHYIK